MRERLPRIKWPHTYPICVLLGIAVALFVTIATAYVQIRLLQPLQRYYPDHLSSLVSFRSGRTYRLWKSGTAITM